MGLEVNSISTFAIIAKIYPLLFTEALLLEDNWKDDSVQIKIESLASALLDDEKLTSLEYLRLMQVVILCKSVRVDEEDEYENEGSKMEDVPSVDNCDPKNYGISLISGDESRKSLVSRFLEEGFQLFDQFLRLHRELKPALLTGWINLLHPIVKSRPAFYPSLIPTLLSFTEPKWSEATFNPVQRRNVLHTLKAELSNLMSVPKAEKFYPLILDSLDKCVALNINKMATTAAASKKSETSTLEDVEEEERELAASLAGIQERMGARPSGAFAETSSAPTDSSQLKKSEYKSLASESLTRELIKIPGPMVTEMVVRMLGAWSIDQIRPVIMSKWARGADIPEDPVSATVGPEVVLKKTTEEAFSLEAGPLTAELPGEIIHLGLSRILQSVTDLSEFHAQSRREDLFSSLIDGKEVNFESINSSRNTSASTPTSTSLGIPIPLVQLCRIIALVAAHVGHVRSDILMDPEERRKKLDRQFDPRFRAAAKKPQTKEKKSGKDEIFGSSSSEEDEDVEMKTSDKIDRSDEDEDFEKSVNQIVLGWINEDLPNRFDFVWFWLEAVWIREGKTGKLSGNENESSDALSDYDRLFDDIIGMVGEFFIENEGDAEGNKEEKEKEEDELTLRKRTQMATPLALERVLRVLLRVPKLNASFIRNLLYPLIEEARFRSIALRALARLLLHRPALRAMLTDFVMTLAESEDSALRRDTIEILLLREGLYPNLRSLSGQLEAYSLDLMDDLARKQEVELTTIINADVETDDVSMKRLKLSSNEGINEESPVESALESHVEVNVDFGEIEVCTELFLGLLKKNPERLLPPLLVRFPRFSVKLQAFLLDRSLPQVVHSWGLKELSGLLRVLRTEEKVNEGGLVGAVVLQIVSLVLKEGSVRKSTDAGVVDFYEDLAELVQSKVSIGTWDGRVVIDLLPWLLRDRSDLPDFFTIYLPKMINSMSAEDFVTTAAPKICSTNQLINSTQLFVQLHGAAGTGVPLKNLIEVFQVIFTQAKASINTTTTNITTTTTNTSSNINNSTVNDQEGNLLFGVSVIAAGLSQLVDQSPLPTLLGRSLLQSVPLLSPTSPALNGAFLLSLLARLIPRKIWESGKLWEGWVRCCRALLPNSLSLLLQLPSAQLEKLLNENGADLKGPLKEYLYNQPPSVRNRYSTILHSIEKSIK